MQGEDLLWLFIPLLFTVAFLYASVGHGGASGYLALMALFSFNPAFMKSSALLLNLFVSFIAFYQYYRGGYFNPRLVVPFIITSIPASFIGAAIHVDATIYNRVLGVLLFFPILRLAGVIGSEDGEQKKTPWAAALLIGAAIGFLYGMIGIGGGILLSPVILLLHWGNMKQTAAASALFIFLNSAAGLAGLSWRGAPVDPSVFILLLFAIAGGALGAWYGRKQESNKVLKLILASVLLVASVKLLTIESIV
jgi:uncharacterized membrane protein YfcA